MIKFFRTLRKRLLSENRFSKYLLYAVGEIVLVVIGILIALQINIWNDEAKQKKTEQDYYCRILEDLELDKERIQTLSQDANERIQISKELLLELDSGKKDKNYLLNKFLLAYRSAAYVPVDVTFKDLVSSGNVKLLTETEIKNSLIKFYSELEDKVVHLNQNRDEKTKESFELVNSSIGFGIAEFEYISELLGPEVIATLPNEEWHQDKTNPHYQNFQMMMTFNIAMSDRKKQVLDEVLQLMEEPVRLLQKQCSKTK